MTRVAQDLVLCASAQGDEGGDGGVREAAKARMGQRKTRKDAALARREAAEEAEKVKAREERHKEKEAARQLKEKQREGAGGATGGQAKKGGKRRRDRAENGDGDGDEDDDEGEGRAVDGDFCLYVKPEWRQEGDLGASGFQLWRVERLTGEGVPCNGQRYEALDALGQVEGRNRKLGPVSVGGVGKTARISRGECPARAFSKAHVLEYDGGSSGGKYLMLVDERKQIEDAHGRLAGGGP